MSGSAMVRSGQKIVFLGDSITQAPAGYVSVTDGLIKALHPSLQVECVNAGIGGHRVTDMLARAETDVVALRPDWVTVSVGINDVWHGENGVPVELFRDKYVELLDLIVRGSGAQMALFTTTVIWEDLDSPQNLQLVAYNDFIRETAAARSMLLVDMDRAFREAISARVKSDSAELVYTSDGVHMQPAGDCLMALTLLRAWGLV